MGSSSGKIIEASSSSSVPRYSSKIWQLYLISANTGSNTAHWGLFLDDGSNQMTGTTWEVNYINERPNRGALLLDQTFPRSASHHHEFECSRKSFVKIKDLIDRGSDATIIHGAASSFAKVEAAKERFLRNFRYKVATTNCQSFVTDILGMLREWDADLVDTKAIETVQRLCFPTVRLTTSSRKKKIQRQDAKHGEARRPQFTSSSGEFSGIDIDAPRKHRDAHRRAYSGMLCQRRRRIRDGRLCTKGVRKWSCQRIEGNLLQCSGHGEQRGFIDESSGYVMQKNRYYCHVLI